MFFTLTPERVPLVQQLDLTSIEKNNPHGFHLMKKLYSLVFTLSLFTATAQGVEKEINEQVWRPFTRAIMSQDVATFASVHSNDLVRAERNSKKVLGLSEYRETMEKSWPRWKERNSKDRLTYVFELRFTERIHNSDLAYEVGYFKNETTNPAGQKEVHYGKFQVALRKESGKWKILVDSDSNEGETITEKDFLAAKPME